MNTPMYLVKTPNFIQTMFPNFVWSMPKTEKAIYLTFDDGPIPEVTPWVIDVLNEYQAKGTFFCVGENVEKHPAIHRRLLDEGHVVGSHTYNHLNGWSTDNIKYFHNVRRGAFEVKSELFRPPYGRLNPKQAMFLQRHYNIIMWDVLSGDFDESISKEKCLKNVLNNTSAGSIVVFHDSLKAKEKLQFVLPIVLEHFTEEGFTFKSIDQVGLSLSHNSLRPTA